MRNVLLLGRVTSGEGGTLILNKARQVLAEDYAKIAESVQIALPDERFRRVGQSAVAAGLPALNATVQQ